MRKNITGQKFGLLTALSFSYTSKHGESYWLCICECGNKITTKMSRLKAGGAKSCGCSRTKKVNLCGERFGLLMAKKCLEENCKWDSPWLCLCDCGNSKVVRSIDLRTERVKSCGCLRFSNKFSKEKAENPRLYRIWQSMKSRCYYKGNKCYSSYGGRGVSICEEWKDSFVVFCAWALMSGYDYPLTIDRIDVNGNYEPGNCRWLTNAEQQKNKRNRHPKNRIAAAPQSGNSESGKGK